MWPEIREAITGSDDIGTPASLLRCDAEVPAAPPGPQEDSAGISSKRKVMAFSRVFLVFKMFSRVYRVFERVFRSTLRTRHSACKSFVRAGRHQLRSLAARDQSPGALEVAAACSAADLAALEEAWWTVPEEHRGTDPGEAMLVAYLRDRTEGSRILLAQNLC